MTRKVDADLLEGVKYKRNFIKNGNAFRNAIGWATYADAAGPAPVDGTGGSATVTWTRSGSSPLVSPGSFRLTKDAANRQGEGASYNFTIDDADRAKVLSIEFDYALVSGTYSNVNKDVSVWIYDITNSRLIQPSGSVLDGVVTSPSNKFRAQFQSSADSSAYRLIFHVSTTSTSAYTIAFDHIEVSRQDAYVAANVTDFSSDGPQFTLTPTSGDATIQSAWRRVGNIMEARATVTIGATPPNSTGILINMPTGYSIDDTAKNGLDGTGGGFLGYVVATPGAAQVHLGGLHMSGPNSFYPAGDDNQGQWADTVPFTWAAGDYYVFHAFIPIVGWSANTMLLGAEQAREVSMRAVLNNVTTPGFLGAVTGYTSVTYDSHAAFNPTTGEYLVKVPGKYSVNFHGMGSTSSDWIIAILYKNGTRVCDGIITVGATYFCRTALATEINCVSGDVLTIYALTGGGGAQTWAANDHSNVLTISRIAGPEAIGAGELVAASYISTSTAAVPNSATVFNFDTRQIDTHNAVTIGSGWKFTAPVTGVYSIAVMFQTTGSVVNAFVTTLRKNSSIVRTRTVPQEVAASFTVPSGISAIIELFAGEQIDIQHHESVNGASYDALGHTIDIFRISGG